jgi:hypothetical protein
VVQSISKKIPYANRSFFICLLAPFQLPNNYIPTLRSFILNIKHLDPPHPDITKREAALQKFEQLRASVDASRVCCHLALCALLPVMCAPD